MFLEQPEKLAKDLEKGLGEIHWLLKGLYPDLRLRTEGVCGVGTVALTEHFRGQGYEVDMVISTPKLSVDPGMQHAMPRVSADGKEAIIDTSYSQFLSYAGQTPGYIMFGGRSMFPENKVAMIIDGANETLVETMTRAAIKALASYEHIEDLGPCIPEFTAVEEDEIRATYAAIWNPAYFHEYCPTEQTLEAGRRLAKFILPDHVRLIA